MVVVVPQEEVVVDPQEEVDTQEEVGVDPQEEVDSQERADPQEAEEGVDPREGKRITPKALVVVQVAVASKVRRFFARLYAVMLPFHWDSMT